LRRFEPVSINPIKIAYDPRQPDGQPSTTSAFNRLSQYASSPVVTGPNAELAVSSPAVAETIASTHCAYPRRDGQAE